MGEGQDEGGVQITIYQAFYALTPTLSQRERGI